MSKSIELGVNIALSNRRLGAKGKITWEKIKANNECWYRRTHKTRKDAEDEINEKIIVPFKGKIIKKGEYVDRYVEVYREMARSGEFGRRSCEGSRFLKVVRKFLGEVVAGEEGGLTHKQVMGYDTIPRSHGEGMERKGGSSLNGEDSITKVFSEVTMNNGGDYNREVVKTFRELIASLKSGFKNNKNIAIKEYFSDLSREKPSSLRKIGKDITVEAALKSVIKQSSSVIGFITIIINAANLGSHEVGGLFKKSMMLYLKFLYLCCIAKMESISEECGTEPVLSFLGNESKGGDCFNALKDSVEAGLKKYLDKKSKNKNYASLLKEESKSILGDFNEYYESSCNGAEIKFIGSKQIAYFKILDSCVRNNLILSHMFVENKADQVLTLSLYKGYSDFMEEVLVYLSGYVPGIEQPQEDIEEDLGEFEEEQCELEEDHVPENIVGSLVNVGIFPSNPDVSQSAPAVEMQPR